jgi:hypothetical protein
MDIGDSPMAIGDAPKRISARQRAFGRRQSPSARLQSPWPRLRFPLPDENAVQERADGFRRGGNAFRRLSDGHRRRSKTHRRPEMVFAETEMRFGKPANSLAITPMDIREGRMKFSVTGISFGKTPKAGDGPCPGRPPFLRIASKARASASLRMRCSRSPIAERSKVRTLARTCSGALELNTRAVFLGTAAQIRRTPAQTSTAPLIAPRVGTASRAVRKTTVKGRAVGVTRRAAPTVAFLSWARRVYSGAGGPTTTYDTAVPAVCVAVCIRSNP